MDPGVAAALITAASVVIVAFLSFLTVFLTRRIGAVHDEVRTNHGKTAGQHIENIEATISDGLGNMGQVLADALADHSAQDADNFEQLRRMLRDLGLK